MHIIMTLRIGIMYHSQLTHFITGVIPTAESQFLEDFKATKINCESKTELLKDFPLPILQPEHPHGQTEGANTISCSAAELHTWVGAVACGLDIYEGGAPGDYVSTLVPPEPHTVCQNGTRTRWTGMVSSKHISTLMEILKYVVQQFSCHYDNVLTQYTPLFLH